MLYNKKMNIIEVKNLVKRFDDITAVDNISFNVKKGEIFAFLGPNGAGKTTTIKMFTTLLQSTSGKVLINGFNPSTHPNDVRRSFGIIFQDPSLDDELTAFENLEFHGVLYNVPKKIRRARIEELLKIVELDKRRNDLVKEFSGGMKRRLEIARGLLHHPKIIFLDEPTLGLDPQTRNHLWSYIKNMNQKENITVFFSTHYMEEADRMSDRVAIIDNGKIVAEGTAEKLKKETSSQTLEDAFLKLTGKQIREEGAKNIDKLRSMRRVWRK
jgi:ABC-2 type transport system ATP-binding protein